VCGLGRRIGCVSPPVREESDGFTVGSRSVYCVVAAGVKGKTAIPCKHRAKGLQVDAGVEVAGNDEVALSGVSSVEDDACVAEASAVGVAIPEYRLFFSIEITNA
jgi:hypothetical protein